MVVVDEKSGWNWRFVWDLSFSVEHFLPLMSSFKRLRVGSVGHDDASRDMSDVKRLESGVWIHILTLVPKLHSDFTTVNIKNLQ